MKNAFGLEKRFCLLEKSFSPSPDRVNGVVPRVVDADLPVFAGGGQIRAAGAPIHAVNLVFVSLDLKKNTC